MKLRLLLFAGFTAGIAIFWILGEQTTQRLRRELASVRRADVELARLRGEHARLLATQPSAAEWDELRRDAAVVTHLERLVAERRALAAAPAVPTAEVPLAQAGRWVPAAEWRRRDRASAAAALETVLWAAARGEVRALRDAIELAPDAHAKAKLLLDTMPATAREPYPTPDDLAALFTARDALFDAVQLVYHQAQGPDHATDALLVKTAGGRTKQISVAYHRSATGEWRLVMPVAAIDKIAAELAGRTIPVKPDVEPPRS